MQVQPSGGTCSYLFVLENILRTTVLRCHPKGYVFAGEVGLPITQDHMILPCGIYGAWSDEDDEVQNSL